MSKFENTCEKGNKPIINCNQKGSPWKLENLVKTQTECDIRMGIDCTPQKLEDKPQCLPCSSKDH